MTIIELRPEHVGALTRFTGEALLRDHIRDRDGRFRDLVVLAHYVDETWAAMATIGLHDEMDS